MALFRVSRHEINGCDQRDSTPVSKPSNPTRARRRADAARAGVPKGSSAWFTVDKSTK